VSDFVRRVFESLEAFQTESIDEISRDPVFGALFIRDNGGGQINVTFSGLRKDADYDF